MGAVALRTADLREFDGEPRLLDLRLAEVLGFEQQRDIRKLIKRNIARLERHGAIFSTMARFPGQRRGPAATQYHLNEKQAYRLCMWSEAPNADAVQEQMVEVFFAYRHGRLVESQRQRAPRRRRKGFGKRSSIEMLPPVCDEDVAWANEQLRLGRVPQCTVLELFNERLSAKGCNPIRRPARAQSAASGANSI